MTNEDIKKIQDISFKPLLYNIGGNQDNQSLVFIFSVDVTKNQSINSSGQKEEIQICTVHVWYVQETAALGAPVLDSVVIKDIDNLLADIVEVDIKDYEDIFLTASEILFHHVQQLNQEMLFVSKAISATYMLKKRQDKGNLIIQGPNLNQNISHLVFSTIDGTQINLNQEEIAKIGSTIGQIIVEHSKDDLDKDLEKFKKRLLAEVEYKVIEALPSKIKLDNIKINIDAVIEEIRKIQQSNGGLLDEQDEE